MNAALLIQSHDIICVIIFPSASGSSHSVESSDKHSPISDLISHTPIQSPFQDIIQDTSTSSISHTIRTDYAKFKLVQKVISKTTSWPSYWTKNTRKNIVI